MLRADDLAQRRGRGGAVAAGFGEEIEPVEIEPALAVEQKKVVLKTLPGMSKRASNAEGTGSTETWTEQSNRASIERSLKKAAAASPLCPASRRKSRNPRRRASATSVSRNGAPPISMSGSGVVLAPAPSRALRSPSKMTR